MLRKELRLRKSGLFRVVCREGKAYVDSAFVVYGKVIPGSGQRVGIAAGKRLGNAVLRNRMKRRFREAMRALVPFLREDLHLVLVVRSGAKQLKSNEIRDRLREALAGSGYLKGGGKA